MKSTLNSKLILIPHDKKILKRAKQEITEEDKKKKKINKEEDEDEDSLIHHHSEAFSGFLQRIICIGVKIPVSPPLVK